MKANLEKFQFTKVNPLKERLANSHYNLNVSSHHTTQCCPLTATQERGDCLPLFV